MFLMQLRGKCIGNGLGVGRSVMDKVERKNKRSSPSKNVYKAVGCQSYHNNFEGLDTDYVETPLKYSSSSPLCSEVSC